MRAFFGAAGFLLAALTLSGCTTLLGNINDREKNYKTVRIDQIHSRVTFVKADGKEEVKDVPPDAEISIDKLTGDITYKNAAFIWRTLFGIDAVPGDDRIVPYLFAGARVGYLGPFGAHLGLAVSTAEDAQNAIVFGLDYRKGDIILGIHLEQPFYLVNKKPMRPGVMLAVAP